MTLSEYDMDLYVLEAIPKLYKKIEPHIQALKDEVDIKMTSSLICFANDLTSKEGTDFKIFIS
jgi:hypothetical protein